MKLIRTDFQADGVFGKLFDDDGYQLAVTLEHAFNGRPKLPVGIYRCQRSLHSLHSTPTPFETFEVMNVPNHTGILFHVGNYNDDSNGCILLGRVVIGSGKGSMVTASRATFDRFMLDLEGCDSFTLAVQDGIPA